MIIPAKTAESLIFKDTGELIRPMMIILIIKMIIILINNHSNDNNSDQKPVGRNADALAISTIDNITLNIVINTIYNLLIIY